MKGSQPGFSSAIQACLCQQAPELSRQDEGFGINQSGLELELLNSCVTIGNFSNL